MDARCSASVQGWDGFSVVTFEIAAPAGAATSAPPPDGMLGTGFMEDYLRPGINGQVAVWRFVVTNNTVSPVASVMTASTSPGQAHATAFDVSTSGWSKPASQACGGASGSVGGTGESLSILFTAACAPA